MVFLSLSGDMVTRNAITDFWVLSGIHTWEPQNSTYSRSQLQDTICSSNGTDFWWTLWSNLLIFLQNYFSEFGNWSINFLSKNQWTHESFFQSLKRSCAGEYQNIDPSNLECQKYLQYYTKVCRFFLFSFFFFFFSYLKCKFRICCYQSHFFFFFFKLQNTITVYFKNWRCTYFGTFMQLYIPKAKRYVS